MVNNGGERAPPVLKLNACKFKNNESNRKPAKHLVLNSRGDFIRTSNAMKLSLSETTVMPSFRSQGHHLHLKTRGRSVLRNHSIATDLNGTGNQWDLFDRHLGFKTPENHGSPVIYEQRIQEVILGAAKNVLVGLKTELLKWSQHEMRYQWTGGDLSCKDLLLQLSNCGSWSMRLSTAVEDIRSATQGINSPLTLLAISAVIDREVEILHLRLSNESLQSQHLVALVAHTEISRSGMETLAALIGCDDLDRNGRLSRIPSAVELLERAYERAVLLDSEMLWRVTGAAMKPWMDQLNFVTGLRDMFTGRMCDANMKNQKFPELFISLDEKVDRVTLDEGLIPSFFALPAALSVCDCYKLLCFISEITHDVDKRRLLMTTEIPPLYFNAPQPTMRHVSLSKKRNRSESNPNKIDVSYQSTSVPAVLMNSFNGILRRRIELNMLCKKEFLANFSYTLTVITDLYLLHNGRFWSLLVDLIPDLHSENYVLGLANVESLIRHEFGDCADLITSVDPKTRQLKVIYRPPKAINLILDDSQWNKLQQVFAKLLDLHAKDPVGFRRYSSKIEQSVQIIHETAQSERAGLFELIDAVTAIEE